ncbi:MAG: multidrug effflux MFS transporter [Proteobacteria bacterium]|nr:multidrug effflux MFS transporter [Pseudomonadota bacterium]
MSASPPSPDGRVPPIFFLGFLAAIGPLALSIHVQSIPAISAAFGTPYAQAQLTVSAFLLSFATSQLIVGPLSDRFGRKPVLYGGLLLFGLASAGAAMANSIELLIVARVLQGAGGCATLVVPRAVVQDTHRGVEAARVMAFVAMLQSTAPSIAPVLGGGIDALIDWRGIFWFLTILSALAALGANYWLRETRPLTGGQPDGWGTIFLRYASLFRSRLYIGYTVAFTFGTSGFFGFLAVGPALLIETRGLDPIWFSVCLTLVTTQFVLGNYTASRLVRRFGIDRVLIAGVIGEIVAGLILFGLSGEVAIAAVVGPVMLYSYFNGYIFANGIAGATGIDPRVAGSAASFLGFAQLGTGAVIAFVMSRLPLDTILPYATTLILVSILAGAGMMLVRTAQRPVTQ